MFLLEVADTDGAKLTVLISTLESAPGLCVDLLPVGGNLFNAGPVDQVQIQVIQSQVFQGSVNCS